MEPHNADVFVWQAKYSVGIPEIDAQHKKLIGLINELFKAMRVGGGDQIMAKLFESLLQYTQQHFAFEENLMRKGRYSGLEAHLEEHRKLISQVQELRTKFLSGKITISIQVMTFLKEWLQAHILGSDAKYAHVLRSAGFTDAATSRV
jgi:hemerythrin